MFKDKLAKKKIPYGRQFIDNADILSVSKSLKNDLITTGPFQKILEEKVSNLLGVKYAITCSSGTAALHLALMSIDLKKDQNIIMPAINFTAAPNIARLIGANIFLTDVDPETGIMTEKNLYDCIYKNNLNSLKAFMPMHLGGNAENNFDLKKIKKKYNAYCIEDACHGLGSETIIKNKKYKIGSCKNSDICTFSLHPLKTITSGEGGLITTNSAYIANKLKLLRSHGIEKNPINFHKNKTTHDDKGLANIWYYQVQNIGLNYRLSDINCSLAYSQLKKIKKFVTRRRKISKIYNNVFSRFNHFSTPENNINLSSCHLYSLKIFFEKIKITRNLLMKKLMKKNIITQVHYIPVYYHPVFKYLKKNWFKGAEKYYNNTLSLPIFFKLNNKQIRYVCKSITQLIK